MQKKKKISLIVLITAVVVVAAAIVAVILSQSGGKSSIAKQLDIGNRFLTELDYENAIASFNEVINIDPNNYEALMGLAKAYEGMEDYQNAFRYYNMATVINRQSEESYIGAVRTGMIMGYYQDVTMRCAIGYGKTGSSTLRDLYDQLAAMDEVKEMAQYIPIDEDNLEESLKETENSIYSPDRYNMTVADSSGSASSKKPSSNDELDDFIIPIEDYMFLGVSVKGMTYDDALALVRSKQVSYETPGYTDNLIDMGEAGQVFIFGEMMGSATAGFEYWGPQGSMHVNVSLLDFGEYKETEYTCNQTGEGAFQNVGQDIKSVLDEMNPKLYEIYEQLESREHKTFRMANIWKTVYEDGSAEYAMSGPDGELMIWCESDGTIRSISVLIPSGN